MKDKWLQTLLNNLLTDDSLISEKMSNVETDDEHSEVLELVAVGLDPEHVLEVETVGSLLPLLFDELATLIDVFLG